MDGIKSFSATRMLAMLRSFPAESVLGPSRELDLHRSPDPDDRSLAYLNPLF